MTEVSRNSNRLYKYCISISYICTYNLHLCICIYIHVNLGRVMDVYAYTYIHTYIHTYTHTHTYIYIYIPVINVCVRSVFSTCLHVSIVTLSTEFNICRSISVCVYTYIYIYTYLYSCIHTHTCIMSFLSCSNIPTWHLFGPCKKVGSCRLRQGSGLVYGLGFVGFRRG